MPAAAHRWHDDAVPGAYGAVYPAIATHQPSATHCCDCRAPIPEPRREALPGVSRCVDCQSILEYFPPLT
ncbi:TraR/DksA C4-type zinc finger protein [Salmonella enterica]|nr:TraR/DksA C4-type zinc finger protein [Salmonella enterica]